MIPPLAGRVAVVTGASSGLGRQMALCLGTAGASVVLIARRADRLEEAERALRVAGARAASVVADLGDLARIPGVAEAASAPFGAPDILVNAAGVNLRQPADDVTLESWQATLSVNLSAPFFLARELVPEMKRRGWGRILNIASLQSVRAFPDSAPYGASKGGIVQLTRAMAQAWSGAGIGVNAIAPGFFPTELTAPVFADVERADMLAARTFVGRNGRLSDIDGLTVFLASPASDYITGQTIFLDGGFSAG